MIYGGRSCARRVLGSISVFVGILGFFGDTSLFAQNAQRQVKPFLKSLERTPYAFDFIRSGLNSVHSVKFDDGVNNQYQTFFNRIILQKSMGTAAGKIKDFSELGSVNFGTLAHESFHAYKANFIDAEPRFEGLKSFMARRAENLYRSIPESKRAVTLEEAYAVFIGWVLQAHDGTLQGFRRLNDENCERQLARMENVWSIIWNSQVNGYWYRDSVPEYWADKLRGIGILIGQGWDAYHEFENREGAIAVEENLGELDRRWVSYNVFEGTISPSFQHTFKDEIAKLSCAKPDTDSQE